jgi:hypothetical protein
VYNNQKKMVDVRQDVLSIPVEQIHSHELNSNINCLNCARMKEQLIAAHQELKSAEVIISLLKEDVKHMYEASVTTILPTSIVLNSRLNLNSDNWKFVNHKNRKSNQAPNKLSVQLTRSSDLTNRFSPLEALEEHHTKEVDCNITGPQIPQAPHQVQGSAIPTIVNGTISVKN